MKLLSETAAAKGPAFTAAVSYTYIYCKKIW